MLKASDWIRLVFAHLFPLNNRAPVASANFISDGKVQPFVMTTYGVASSYTLMMEHAQLMGALFLRQSGGHNPVLIQSHPLKFQLLMDFRKNVTDFC